MERPNILFILSDDQGEWAMGCSGNAGILTPNIDALARRGLRFDHFFCTSPVCSPARASLLTGTIPSRHGILDYVRGGNLDMGSLPHLSHEPELASEHRAIGYLDGFTAYTDLLARAAYVCALSGKWHLEDSVRPQHGFSKWFTIGRGGCHYNRADIVEDGQVAFREGYVTDMITGQALRFLDELTAPGQSSPFYLSVHYTAPHSPWDRSEHPQGIWKLYEGHGFPEIPDLPPHPWHAVTAPSGTGERRLELLTGYYTAVTAMDRGIGLLLDRLRASGKLDNTLVLFTSDNGMNMGHHGVWGKGNGTFPMNMYDTSVKVPLIVSWPGHVPQGEVNSSLLSQYDVLPTLADYLGLNGMPDGLPGRSFAGTLRGGRTDGEDTVVVYDEYGPVRMIRSRSWKYVHRYPYGPNELYNLREDPGEERNLIRCGGKAEAEARRELKAQMERWFLQYADPAVDGVREPVTGFGQLCRAGVYADGQDVYCDS